MKKMILVGRSECGKTTLRQALKGETLHYHKTQYVNHYDVIIDTPGEYAETGTLGRALALYSYEADVTALLINSNEPYSLYPPCCAAVNCRPTIGIVTQIDGNVIGPKILGKSTGLSAFWVVFSVMFFGKLWGIIGMLIGVPVFGVIYYVLDTFVNFQLGRRELTVETDDYKNLDYFAEDGTRVMLDGKKTPRELRKEEQKELRRQWMEENQENFERWLHQHKKKEDDDEIER